MAGLVQNELDLSPTVNFSKNSISQILEKSRKNWQRSLKSQYKTERTVQTQEVILWQI